MDVTDTDRPFDKTNLGSICQELRDKINGYVLADASNYVRLGAPPPAITQVCRKLRNETYDTYYKHKVLVIDTTDFGRYDNTLAFDYWVTMVKGKLRSLGSPFTTKFDVVDIDLGNADVCTAAQYKVNWLAIYSLLKYFRLGSSTFVTMGIDHPAPGREDERMTLQFLLGDRLEGLRQIDAFTHEISYHPKVSNWDVARVADFDVGLHKIRHAVINML